MLNKGLTLDPMYLPAVYMLCKILMKEEDYEAATTLYVFYVFSNCLFVSVYMCVTVRVYVFACMHPVLCSCVLCVFPHVECSCECLRVCMFVCIYVSVLIWSVHTYVIHVCHINTLSTRMLELSCIDGTIANLGN